MIGIIAILIGILLPALSKARDTARAVACQANERSFYNIWAMYANDYKGYVVPATEQAMNAEYDYCDPQILGQELGKVPGMIGGSGTARSQGTALVIKLLLTCPAAEHSLDPNTGQTNAVGGTSGYWGDYIYNYQMGVLKYDASGVNYVFYEQQRINRVPGNVIILMESMKPNYPSANYPTYKSYFTNWPDLFSSGSPAAKSTSLLTFNRIGTPHNRNTKMNCLFADGHIGAADPKKDFFASPADQRTVKEYLWDAAINLGTLTSPPSYQSSPSYPNGGWKPGVNPGF